MLTSKLLWECALSIYHPGTYIGDKICSFFFFLSFFKIFYENTEIIIITQFDIHAHVPCINMYIISIWQFFFYWNTTFCLYMYMCCIVFRCILLVVLVSQWWHHKHLLPERSQAPATRKDKPWEIPKS
jgi:hypothetical protein